MDAHEQGQRVSRPRNDEARLVTGLRLDQEQQTTTEDSPAAALAQSPRLPGIRKRTRRCYELSARGQMRAPDWTLVHGACRHDLGFEFGHAWLERDGQVYDAVRDEFMPLAEYLERAGARRIVSYTNIEAVQQMLAQNVYGPWDDRVPG